MDSSVNLPSRDFKVCQAEAFGYSPQNIGSIDTISPGMASCIRQPSRQPRHFTVIDIARQAAVEVVSWCVVLTSGVPA